MTISDFAIRRPVITVVSMLALVVFGLFSLALLQTDEFPDVAVPLVVVAVPYPGASPDNVEREIVDPLEEGISGISGVKKVTSNAMDGFATVLVEFVYEKDLQEATQEIRDEINAIRNELPPEMEEPILTRVSPTDFPIVAMSIASETMSVPQLTILADPGVTRRLRAIPGVGEVNIAGANTREMTIDVRPDALQAANISMGEVVGAVAAQNLAVPVGRLIGINDERTIRLAGRVGAAEEFAQIVIANRGGRVIRLGDVATVHVGVEEPRTEARFNGTEAVGIDVKKAKGYSTTQVANSVLAAVEDIRSTLPPGVTISVVRDSGTRVANSVANVGWALVEGAALTVLTVFLFLNSWRSTIITGLALPVSVIASFVAVLVCGFTLNTMSLLGLSLAIGILIDDAIVVRENIVRHVEQGGDHFTAAHEGTSEIALAVAATTFSIVVVFVPIAFMGGVAEQWMAPFALTIACSVLVSLFVSFSLDPMLSAYWPDPHLPIERRPWISRQLARFNDWFNRQADRYKSVISWALRHRVAMVLLAIGSFVGALAMPAMGLLGGEFFPVSDNSEFSVSVQTPPGSSLAYTSKKMDEVSALARGVPGVSHTYATIGGTSGSVDEGNVYVALAPKHTRDMNQEAIARSLRQKLRDVGGATASIQTSGLDNQKQIQVQIRGPENEVLTRIADQLMTQVRDVPGAVDVGLSTRGQKPEMDVRVDRGLAGALGLRVGDIAQALRPAFAGVDVGDWVDPTGKTRDVTVRLAPEARARAADLSSLPLVVPDAEGRPTTVPLGQVATIKPSLGPTRIDHLDRERVISVQANTEGRPLSDVVADIQTRIDAIPLGAGYSITQGGQTAEQQEVFTRILVSLVVGILLMYLVLVVQFGSFLDPLAIMISLPLSLIGVVGALMLTGDTLNIMSLIGVILLMGIVAKNAILLIDFAKWSEEKGMARREAIIEAGRARLRPILMTTLALIAGMIPVALGRGEGADFRAPLGRAIIGGVITSTLLTLLVIPTFYDILAGMRDRVRRLFGRDGARRRHPEPEHVRLVS
jgi:hydrophobic/amphiphilic exporter-1 (mainly G- bacteria), HAE1 family